MQEWSDFAGLLSSSFSRNPPSLLSGIDFLFHPLH